MKVIRPLFGSYKIYLAFELSLSNRQTKTAGLPASRSPTKLNRLIFTVYVSPCAPVLQC